MFNLSAGLADFLSNLMIEGWLRKPFDVGVTKNQGLNRVYVVGVCLAPLFLLKQGEWIYEFFFLLLISIFLFSCSQLPISQPLVFSKTNTGQLEWTQKGIVTECQSNVLADFRLTLPSTGIWRVSYRLKNYDPRKSRLAKNVITILFQNPEGEPISLIVGNETVPSGKLKNVKTEGQWADQITEFESLMLMTVTIKHECEEI